LSKKNAFRDRPIEAAAAATAAAPRGRRRWLLLVHQLPSQPSNLRVRTWRRLQQLGAVAVKQAVYALPDSPGAREDFEWLKSEILAEGGEASVFAADSVDAWSEDELVEEFRRSRQEAYQELSRDIEKFLKKTEGKSPRRARPSAGRRALDAFRQRFSIIESVDFFGSAGRDKVAALLTELEARTARSGGANESKPDPSGHRTYKGRLWVTRPRPGVDRMASAWLIRRFIDKEARFGFVADPKASPRDSIPYDMFGVEFTHRGNQCTFETLLGVFGIDDPAVERMAAIVHDLDLKDGHFAPPEGPAIAMVIEGLQLGLTEDDALLAEGLMLFEALYRSFDHSLRPSGPRALATKRRRSRGTRSRSSS
jgi:hypothetical protein